MTPPTKNLLFLVLLIICWDWQREFHDQLSRSCYAKFYSFTRDELIHAFFFFVPQMNQEKEEQWYTQRQEPRLLQTWTPTTTRTSSIIFPSISSDPRLSHPPPPSPIPPSISSLTLPATHGSRMELLPSSPSPTSLLLSPLTKPALDPFSVKSSSSPQITLHPSPLSPGAPTPPPPVTSPPLPKIASGFFTTILPRLMVTQSLIFFLLDFCSSAEIIVSFHRNYYNLEGDVVLSQLKICFVS